MKTINTSLYDFARLRDPQSDYVYVDKTSQLHEICKPGTDTIYYLPRPRRFGKSLMISTIKCLFQGRRDLFEGLAIDSMGWDWEREVYPVLHLDMAQVASPSAAMLEQKLQKLMELTCEEFGVPFDPAVPASANFMVLLKKLPSVAPKAANGRYVVLIDEYDAPISGLLDSEEGRRELPMVRKTLHDFYVQAKSECGNMRFLMVTGVSKFAKTSIFSAFNNPKDLSLDRRAADLLGYTHEEMEKCFHEHIQAFADEKGVSYDKMFAQLLEWYDSYQFCPSRLVKVINPVSLGNALSNREFGNYWEATAGSTLVYEALKSGNRAPFDLAARFNPSDLDCPDALEASAVALLYQGGYLTIDRYLPKTGKLLLKIPNREVTQSLERGYVRSVLGKDFALNELENAADDFVEDLETRGITDFFKRMLVSVYSKLPHDWKFHDEVEVKRYFMAFMVFARAEVVGEEQHSLGRPDAVLRTEKGIYVFEFKYARSAAAALAQCRDRRYADAFAADSRPVTYVGVNYDPAKRTVDDVKTERVQG